MQQPLDELRQAIADAQRKQIEVMIGTPSTPGELDAAEKELGVRFPADYRLVALEVGALSFRMGQLHYLAFGKVSEGMRTAGVQADLLEMGRMFQEANLPFSEDTTPIAVAPVAARLDPDNGHFESILVDANGDYRVHFYGGYISEPRSLVNVLGIFPHFAMMFHDDGSRLSANELLDKMGVIRSN